MAGQQLLKHWGQGMTLAPETNGFLLEQRNVRILPYDECCSDGIGIVQADSGVARVGCGCSGGL